MWWRQQTILFAILCIDEISCFQIHARLIFSDFKTLRQVQKVRDDPLLVSFRRRVPHLLLSASRETEFVGILEEQLKIAVAEERYGDAARIRDSIREASDDSREEQPISFWCLTRRGASIDSIRERCQVITVASLY